MKKSRTCPNPYPGEHAARLRAPSKKRYVRVRAYGYDDPRNTFPKGVRPVYGILRKRGPAGGKTELQALRFKRTKWTPARAKAWLARQGYRTMKFEVATGKYANPALMVISNPRKKRASKKRAARKPAASAVKTYKAFHMAPPGQVAKVWIPPGWPKNLVCIGSVDRLDIQEAKTGREISKRYSGDKVKVCMTSSRRELFILGMNGKGLGLKSGIAMRIDYTVPPTSGRRKWSARWWHPHDTGPALRMDKSGKAARVKGPKLKINVRGIIG